MLLILAAALALGNGAAAQRVDIGTGDWSGYPEIRPQGDHALGPDVTSRIEQISRDGWCRVEGLNGAAVNLAVPAMLRIGEEGTVERIVLRDLGCPELETALGLGLQAFAQAGAYQVTQPGWYRTEIRFATQ